MKKKPSNMFGRTAGGKNIYAYVFNTNLYFTKILILYALLYEKFKGFFSKFWYFTIFKQIFHPNMKLL